MEWQNAALHTLTRIFKMTETQYLLYCNIMFLSAIFVSLVLFFHSMPAYMPQLEKYECQCTMRQQNLWKWYMHGNIRN